MAGILRYLLPRLPVGQPLHPQISVLVMQAVCPQPVHPADGDPQRPGGLAHGLVEGLLPCPAGVEEILHLLSERVLRNMGEAGRVGFEPTTEVLCPCTHLAGEPNRPLWHLPLLGLWKLF